MGSGLPHVVGEVGEGPAFGGGPSGQGEGEVCRIRSLAVPLWGDSGTGFGSSVGRFGELASKVRGCPRPAGLAPWIHLHQEQTQESRGAQICGQTVRILVVREGRFLDGNESLEGLESQVWSVRPPDGRKGPRSTCTHTFLHFSM